LFTRVMYPDNSVGDVFTKVLPLPFPLPFVPLYKSVAPPVYFILVDDCVPKYTAIPLYSDEILEDAV
jgi:hypothetical protein